ncbi:hypothetical protein CVD28_10050 [Bacillus sp. M6-12]|uniref:CPBP family glutamic-type intramembrane protease n=1 Tax=Bacillus sp. M6-12 TaxID=2054166 RepID=UPI000C7736CF|nr:CPBP family intramembrane glutamic endopeptidase [Bacillus sp. M6-12]PLS18013.1 hypothetical protein CVD28_10050 [Bacillus sp. M6-12]
MNNVKETIHQPVFLHNNINKKANTIDIYFSLIMRSLFFIIFGTVFVAILSVNGAEQPLKEAEKWWPFQVVLANIISFIMLTHFLRKEKKSYISLFKTKRIGLKKSLKEFFLLVIVAVVSGAVPLYVFSYLFLGSIIPPDNMFQPLPVWAALIALIIFPVSNALVELPTYIGYALPRLEQHYGSKWKPIIFAGMALALQHVFLPLIFDPSYMLWRFFSFIPMAIILGAIFLKTRRLSTIIMVHYLLDLQLIIQTFMYSIK